MGAAHADVPSLSSHALQALRNVVLTSRQLTSLSLAGCASMSSLTLDCPSLQTLQLANCDRLGSATLTVAALRGLNLGICPHLNSITLSAPHMTSLDLRGCGVLEETVLRCPRLESLDASYCNQLKDGVLGQMANSCSAVTTLVVAACSQVTARGLKTLSALSLLTRLDLSYTFLTDLTSVYEACGNLENLQLLACKYLEDGALRPLYMETKLPRLRHLDLSYTCLSQNAIGDVIARCRNLRTLSVNGCQHINNSIWESVVYDANGSGFVTGAIGTGVSRSRGAEEDDVTWSSADAAPGDEDKVQVGVGQVTLVTAGGGKILLGRILKPPTHFSEMGEVGSGVVTGGVPGQRLPRQLPAWARGQVPGREGQRRLESLSFVGCSDLTRVLIPLSSASARLTALNLALARGVKTVHLACPNLATLNLR